ncbi:MAG: SctU family type III secretion system export apparatus subunit VscU [Opitutales bacterium]
MSGSESGEKTEDPTPKRLRDSRKKGQVAKSTDVSSTFIIIMIFMTFAASWDHNLNRVKDLITLAPHFYEAPVKDAIYSIMRGAVYQFVMVSLPFVLVTIAAGLFINFVQVGFVISFESVKPDIKKLNPIEGVKKIFSVKNFVEFLKSSIKIIFISILVYIVVKKEIDPIIKIPFTGLQGLLTITGPVIGDIVKNVVLGYIMIAVFDYFFQKKNHIKQLRMTKDEVKREYKEMEGDPEIKGKRKQLHKELVMNDAVENTRKSSVLITNPTHYAVALYYKMGQTELPIVTAKGQGYLAQMMMKAAKESDVPIMRNVPLAHSLYNDAQEKSYIPQDLIRPVVEVLAWVESLNQGRL